MASGSTADRASTNSSSPWPASILLAQDAYVAVSRNDTTATAKSRANHTVEVTFWIADPPAVSFYTFHCFKPPPISDSDSEDEDADDNLEVRPHVVGAEGRFVLFRTFFASGDNDYEHFLYRGDRKSPSLEGVPLPDDDRLHGVSDFGIVPRGGDHCLLVALCDGVTRKDYLLHVYSSEDRTWTTKELLYPSPGPTLAPYKVTLLRDGVLVWVDFVRGLLVCDVLQEPFLQARYIPLPEPLPLNREEILKQSVPEASVMRYRDVACVDGLLKFVEMERRVTVTTTEVVVDVPPEKPPSDPRNKDVLYDSDLITLYKRKCVDRKPKTLRQANGWSAMTWTRELGSPCWLKGSVVDVDDILVDDSALSALLQRNEESAGRSLAFKNMYSTCPILSTDGNDILYLKSSTKVWGPTGWVVAVDLADKTLKVEAAHCFGSYSPSQQRFLPCALVNHLKITPGIKVSAFQIVQTGSSANEPNNTAISVGEPDSYESENKRPRRLAEKDNHAQDGAQSTAQNVLGSQARPDHNNMPPQLCANRLEEPGYGGYSSCPPNPPLPQCFNKSTGPCNPVYAPWPPAPDMRSYGNYQSLWQQPLLPEQQMAPRRAFQPHVAPHPYFNNWSDHGNSQQQPAGNSYSYGAHSGSGNQGSGYRPIYHDYHSGSGNHGNSQQHPAYNSCSYGAHSGNGNQGFGHRPMYHDYHSGSGNQGFGYRPVYQYDLGSGSHGNSQQHPASNSYSYGARSGSGNQGFGHGPIYHDYRC